MISYSEKKYSTLKCYIMMVAIMVSLFLSMVNFTYAVEGTDIPGDDTGSGTDIPASNVRNGTVTLQNPLNVNSVGEVVNKGVEIFTYIAILGAVIALIIVGLRFIMAQGKPDKLKEAGQWLWYIVIGVAIILGARLMISVVINTLEATKTVNPEVIQSAKQAVRGQ